MITDKNKVKITNANGEFIEFGRYFKLLSGINLSGLKANVSYSGSNNDGATYQRTILNNRDVDISFYIDKKGRDDNWTEQKRKEIIRVLNPKYNPMKMEFSTKGGSSYYINLNLEAVPDMPEGFENCNKSWQKVIALFSCNDPNIYEANEQSVDIALWIGTFEFPLEIVEGGIEMGYRSPSLIANVYNSGDSDTGMIVRFKAIASVSKPKLININTYDEMQINFEMQGGDVIEVNTNRGKKSVTLIRNNIRTNIFNAFDLYSTWLQLKPGDNLFRYDAESGLDNLEVSMNFTNKFVGV